MGIMYSFLCLLSLCFSSLEGEVGLPWQAWAGKGLLAVPPPSAHANWQRIPSLLKSPHHSRFR